MGPVRNRRKLARLVNPCPLPGPSTSKIDQITRASFLPARVFSRPQPPPSGRARARGVLGLVELDRGAL